MNIFKRMKEDMDTVFEGDPAARSYIEIFFTYSGLHAIWMHRIAHMLYRWRLLFIARALSQINRFLTGVEIHPAAKIGRKLFIDHGMGIVIGETCEIGNHVTLYQGVTLGGTGNEKGKRHPTIEDHALIAVGAKVLGGITIGEHSKVGGGAVVLHDVPPHATVVGIPGRVVRQNGVRVPEEDRIDLDHHKMPDPISDRCDKLQTEIDLLKKEIKKLKEGEKDDHSNI